MNVFIIGDCHLKANAPVSRSDDYGAAILAKLEYLASIAPMYNCKTFLILGDVFDAATTTLAYLSNVINTFKKITNAGITTYTIAGNHDLKNNRMDSLNATALGILALTGYIKMAPAELNIDNTIFKCYSYPDKLLPKASNNYEVCIAHKYYEYELAHDSLHKDDVINLNYDAMILGHYHVPCETEQIGNTILYRPGSLARCTSELYNKLRTPRVLVFNCINHKAMYIDVACRPGSEIYIKQVEANDQISLSMKDLIQCITSTCTTSDLNIREYFSQLDIPYFCKTKIAKYLDNLGV